MSTATANVDIDALKQRLRATWMAGDYDRFSRFMESTSHNRLRVLRAVARAARTVVPSPADAQ